MLSDFDSYIKAINLLNILESFGLKAATETNSIIQYDLEQEYCGDCENHHDECYCHKDTYDHYDAYDDEASYD